MLNLRIYPNDNLLWVIASGVVTIEEANQAVEQLRHDAGTRTVRRSLVDLCSVTSLRITWDEVWAFADERQRIFSPSDSGTRLAFVAKPEGSFGMARVYQTFSEGCPERVEVFTSVNAAVEWLGLDVNSLVPPGKLVAGKGI